MSITGLVLCGGQSSRMGTDKGLMMFRNKSWCSIIFDKLSYFCTPVYVSINSKQLDSYTTIFNTNQFIVDTITNAGPMAGLVSLSSKIKTSSVLVMPCDMIDFDLKYLELLVSLAKNNPNYDCFAFKENSFLQPFPSIITSNIIANMNNPNTGLSHFLNSNKLLTIPLENTKTVFKNYNTMLDIG